MTIFLFDLAKNSVVVCNPRKKFSLVVQFVELFSIGGVKILNVFEDNFNRGLVTCYAPVRFSLR